MFSAQKRKELDGVDSGRSSRRLHDTMTSWSANGSRDIRGRVFLLLAAYLLSASPAAANCTIETVEKLVAVRNADSSVSEQEIREIQEICDWNVDVNACTFRRV